MENQEKYQPTEEEIKKVEEMMTGEEKIKSEERAGFINLLGDREKIVDFIRSPIDKLEHAKILKDRMDSIVGMLPKQIFEKDLSFDVETRSNRMYGVLSIAKDYIIPLSLSKNDKLSIFDKFKEMVLLKLREKMDETDYGYGSPFQKMYEAEERRDRKLYSAYIKTLDLIQEELEKEIE